MPGRTLTAKELVSDGPGMIRDVLIFGVGAHLVARAFRFLYILVTNLLTAERLPYTLMYSNWGRSWELRDVLSHLAFAPLVETAIFCALIWKVCARLGLRDGAFIAVSATAFGLLHVRLGLYEGLNSAIGGVFFAWVFAKYARRWPDVLAYWIAALTHMLANSLVMLA